MSGYRTEKFCTWGKGSGNRLDQHRYGTVHFIKTGRAPRQPRLYSALAALIKSGDDFTGRKVFESDNEAEAFKHEFDAIRRYGIDTLLNGVSHALFGLINSQKVAAYRLAQREATRRVLLRSEPERKRKRAQRLKQRRERVRMKKLERERLRAKKLELENAQKLERELSQKLERERAGTLAHELEKVSLKIKRQQEQEWEKKLLARKISSPTVADFAWGTVKPAPGRQILNFLFPSTPKTAY